MSIKLSSVTKVSRCVTDYYCLINFRSQPLYSDDLDRHVEQAKNNPTLSFLYSASSPSFPTPMSLGDSYTMSSTSPFT